MDSGGSENLAPKLPGVEKPRKCSLRGLLAPKNARKCSLRGLLASKNARKCSLRGLLASKNDRKCSFRGLQTPRNRRKRSLRSLGDFKNSRRRRTGGQKNDRRAGLEATLLEDAQLRAFHARVHTSTFYILNLSNKNGCFVFFNRHIQFS